MRRCSTNSSATPEADFINLTGAANVDSALAFVRSRVGTPFSADAVDTDMSDISHDSGVRDRPRGALR
ncbi:hypothetical protein C455_15133 [Haloferax larsenii JCM 13917]|nr:hypothetical protein C455_15133 [Haloferax larsenii JCM 13917]